MKKSVADLVTHDGLHDSLTGLASFPAFMESATREISLAIREQIPFNLFLISLSKFRNEDGELIEIKYGKELSYVNEEYLYRLAAQLIHVAGILQSELRESDLLSRYALTEFLLMNKGEYEAIEKKLENLGERGILAIAGTKINFANIGHKDRDSRRILLKSISFLQKKMIEQN